MHPAGSPRQTLIDPEYNAHSSTATTYNPYTTYNEDIVHSRSRSSIQPFIPNSPRRRSVFSGRSRSNTTTSTNSSRRSPASSMTSTDQAPSLPSSGHDSGAGGFYPPSRERQDSITKSLLTRGSRILRRQGSKFNIAATLDEVDEGEREKPRFDVGDIFTRHRSSRQCDTSDNIKRLISDPYDFHHLTHTNPSQFQSLEQARQNDLVTEFSAIRASQKPVTNLKGIRAQDLHFRDFSSEDLTGVATSGDDEHAFAISSAPSPPVSPGASISISPKQEVPPQRESRVYENFSRPVSRYPRNGSSGSGSSIATNPPHRQLASSPEMVEPTPRAIDHVLGLPSQQASPEHVSPRKASLSQMNLAALFEADDESHALAAGPGSTDPRASSTNLLDLEDVPEEEEAAAVTHWHDSPEQQGPEVSVSHLSPSPAQMGPPVVVSNSHPSICVAEELSKKISEALTSPTLPQYLYQQHQQVEATPEQDGPVCDPIYESWDADIDYCYEHAAESTSDFDWSRRSCDEPRVVEERQQSMHLSTLSLPCPELDPSPSQSVPSSHLAATPSTAYGGDYFQVPAIYPSAVSKQMTQDMYDEYTSMAANDTESDPHFAFCSQGVIQPPMDQMLSPRSSISPMSKYNSQESLILSRAASIARKHRSSVSTASVPELVHSLASSREHVPESPSLPSGPDSSYHRQTKSLEMTKILGSSASLDSVADLPSTSGPSLHDRAKSTSDLLGAALAKANTPLPPTPTMKDVPQKKGRYSLFPTAN